MPDGLGWRTRVQFAVAGDGVPGLHRHRSSEVETLETEGGCGIGAPQARLVEQLDGRVLEAALGQPELEHAHDLLPYICSGVMSRSPRVWSVPSSFTRNMRVPWKPILF